MAFRGYNNENSDPITQEDLKRYHATLLESKVEIDNEALIVVANLLRLNASPDDIYIVLKQIAPVCGLLKKFKLKPQKSSSLENNR